MKDFRLGREWVLRILGVQSPDVAKLPRALLIRNPTYSESIVVSSVATLEGAPVTASLHPSLNMSKGTVYSRNCEDTFAVCQLQRSP